MAAALGLLVVWANMHSLFAIGLALIGAALMGLALRPALAHHLAAKGESDSTGVTPTSRSSARRLGSTLALGLLLTALNPRGFEQHLTFYVSSRASAIWMIRDEWLAFDPLRFGQYPAGAVSPGI